MSTATERYSSTRICYLLTLSLPRVPSSKLRQKSWISFCKIVKHKQHHMKVLLNSFHLNGHTLGFHPQTQKLEPHLLTLLGLTLGVKGLSQRNCLFWRIVSMPECIVEIKCSRNYTCSNLWCTCTRMPCALSTDNPGVSRIQTKFASLLAGLSNLPDTDEDYVVWCFMLILADFGETLDVYRPSVFLMELVEFFCCLFLGGRQELSLGYLSGFWFFF